MFGKGGGPLSAWIKEFCELVFIQTLQAFIFALVIGFVISILDTQVTMEQSDRSASLGIICIVALTSIFKVEDIARRIFGYGPTKADHGNAVQSIGKSMMALRMGKNLLDNGKKIVTGAGAAIGSHGKKVKALKRMNAKVAALEKDNGTSAESTSGTETKGGRKIDSAKRDQKLKLTEDARKAKNLAMGETDAAKKKALLDEARKKLEEAKNIDDTLVETSSGGRIKDYNQKKMQLEEEYNDKIDEIKKQRRQGIKQMVSGVAESGAALVGFTAGTAMSAASTNDWSAAVKDGITWAGTADVVTAGAVDLAGSTVEFLNNRVKNMDKLIKEYGDNVKSEYDNAIRELEKEGKAIDEKAVLRAARKSGRSKTTSAHSVKKQKQAFDDALKRLDKMNNTTKASETDGGVFK